MDHKADSKPYGAGLGVGEIEAAADREEGMISTPSSGDTLPIQEQLQPFSSNHSPLSALNGKTRKHHA